MKPVISGPLTSKRRSFIQKTDFKKNASKKKKHQQKSVKKFWKLKGKPLVAQSHSFSRPPPKRYRFPADDEESSSDENSSDGPSDDNSEVEYTDDGFTSSLPSKNNVVKAKEILTFVSQKSGFVILLVKHPISFAIDGTVAIRVISGSASVLGYELCDNMDFNYIYSAKNICHLAVETTSCHEKSLLHLNVLLNKLKFISYEKQVASIKAAMTDSTVVIVLKENLKANFVKFAHFHIPSALPLPPFNTNTGQLIEMGFTIGNLHESTVKLSKAHDDAVDIIKYDINSFVVNGGRTPRILVYGKKGLGKSTSLRYFINKVLSSDCKRKPLYLDIDLGQAEFTLPGCISLTKIKGPLLGPSYTHQKLPITCKFFGQLTLETPHPYLSLLKEVVDLYLLHFPNRILFINTLGWTKGLGLDALKMVEKELQPTIKIELTRDVIGASEISVDEVTASYPRELKIPGHVRYSSSKVPPAKRRGIQILSYFGTQIHNPLQPVNALPCYCVAARDVAMHIIDAEYMQFGALFASINCSIVALCVVKKHEIVQPEEENESPRIAPGSSFGECKGFGFVRAIDTLENLLYVIAPLEYLMLREVNALVKGHVHMPNEVFIKQLPFLTPGCEVNNVQIYTGVMTPLEKKVKRRTFRRNIQREGNLPFL